jgi:hypothetical protein
MLGVSLIIQIGIYICLDWSDKRYLLEQWWKVERYTPKGRRKLQLFCITGSVALTIITQQFCSYSMSELWLSAFYGLMVLEIFEWLHLIFAIIPPWWGSDPLFEQTLIPFLQGWSVPRSVKIDPLSDSGDFEIFPVYSYSFTIISLLTKGIPFICEKLNSLLPRIICDKSG